MYEDLADFSVEYLQKRGASYVEARLEDSLGNSVVLKNGIPQISEFSHVNGIGIRFILNDSLGFVSTNRLNKEKIKEILEKGIRTTRKSLSISEKTDLAGEEPHNLKYEVKQKINLDGISAEERVSLLLDAERELDKLKIKLPARFLQLSDNTTKEYLVTSEGTKITSIVPKVMFFYYITISENNKTAQRYWQYGGSGGWEIAKSWNIKEILCNEAKAMQKNLKFGIKAPKEDVDIIVAPQVTGIMVHESAGHPYEADRIFGREAAQAGESFVTEDMIGYQIGSDIVNVVDDPTIENSYGFFLYDNEGVKARRKCIIKDGKINEFLHNRETAVCMGLKSNGSSRAVDYDKESIVRMSNTFMLPGDCSEEELIKDTKKGVYIKNFMEWNIDDKRLNQKYVGAEAYMIRNGEIKEPVINPTIETSSLKLYKAIVAVANNVEHHAGNCGKGEPMQSIPVWFGGPSLKFKGLRLK